MGKITGFLEYERAKVPKRPVKERIKDFKEVTGTIDDKTLREQAARCMDCGTPFCHAFGCPNGNLIPDFNDMVYRGQWEKAYRFLEETSIMPEITGRVCPAPCEASCTLSINSAPVNIKQIEKRIGDMAFEKGWVKTAALDKKFGKRVAVIGSGPAGLSAAYRLRMEGHKVTVYEKSPKPGGLLRYGIPHFKLDKKIVDRRIDVLRKTGINFETSIEAGVDISARLIRDRFDAVLLAQGAGTPRDLNIQGRHLKGIHFAMDYLIPSNLYVDGDTGRDKMISAEGRNVLVIGGGDTGSDCVGTAVRQGAKKVYQFEIMPKPMEWNSSYNPEWPHYPKILRTSTSHEEGCERDWNIQTESFEGDDRVKRVNFSRIRWEKDDQGSRPKPERITRSDFSLDIDLVLLAAGFLHVEHSNLIHDFGIELDKRGNIQGDSEYSTSIPGIYTAGDSNTGASLVIRAMYHGRKAAESMISFLRNARP